MVTDAIPIVHLMHPQNLKRILLPESYNYIGVFLTLACPYDCSYCINNYLTNPRFPVMRGDKWVKLLNRLEPRDVPVTLQGGEPGVHTDFIYIINHLREDIHIDILTALIFDVDKFIREVDPQRLNREAPYAPIRVSFHPEMAAIEVVANKVLKLMDAGFYVGIFGIEHPAFMARVAHAKEYCERLGIDFRLKSLLGTVDGKLYGHYLYEEAVSGRKLDKDVLCKTKDLLIAPDGCVYRCHHDLYDGGAPVGHLADDDFSIKDIFRPCREFGLCNPCDIKVKFNRFQKHGHCSVEIKFKERTSRT